jgi:IPT/TIG domain
VTYPFQYGSFRKLTEDGVEVLSDYVDEGDVIWDGKSNDLPIPHSLHVVTKTPGTVTLGWSATNSPRVDGFGVYMDGELVLTTEDTGHSATVDDLMAEHTYHFSVVSVGDGKHSNPSGVITVTTPVGEAALPPTDVLVYAGNGKVGAEWSDPDNQDGSIDYYTASAYSVVSSDPDVYDDHAAGSANSDEGLKRVVIDGLDNSSEYVVRVSAHSAFGQGSSEESGVSAHVVPRPAPTITSVDPSMGLDGVMVTIHGHNFVGERPGETGSIDVTFGGVLSGSVVVVSNTEIQAQASATTETEANSDGTVDVQVLIQPSDWPDRVGTLPSGFTFVPES